MSKTIIDVIPESTQTEIIGRAIQVYGEDYQLSVAVEELSELTKEICKHKRGLTSKLNIAEEIADVEIVLQELKMIFDNHDLVEVYKRKKIKRLADRLQYEN